MKILRSFTSRNVSFRQTHTCTKMAIITLFILAKILPLWETELCSCLKPRNFTTL